MIQKAKQDGFQGLRVMVLSLSHMLHDTYSSFLAPVLPLIIENLGISYALAGLLSVIQRIPSLLNPFVGLAIDRLPVKYFIIFAPLVTAISMSLIGLAPSYGVLAILLFVSGVSSTVFHVPAPVMIRRLAGKRNGMGMSFYMFGGELARTLGPLTILGAISLWGFAGSWRLTGFALVVTVLLWYELHSVDLHARNETQSDSMPHIREDVKQIIPFLAMMGAMFFFRSSMKSALTIFLPTFLKTRGASLFFAGAGLSVLQFAGAAGTFIAGTFSDYFGRRKTLILITSVNPILMALFILAKGIWVLPVLLLTGFFLFAFGPVTLAMVHDIPHNRPAFINGLYMTMNFVLSALATFLIGWLADLWGLESAYIIANIMALAAIPFAAKIPLKTSPPHTPNS
ncbi:MFS transporter [Fidelibacter multiformis]|uniref:MFS transporter n=1 Tax=Fidelibacter multiformis TaxID=3377529 RepID=UPI0037DC5011